MLKPSMTKAVGALAVGAAALFATAPATADHHLGYQVEIKITNLTRGQVLSPVIAATHDRGLAPLFTLGEAASPAVAAMAEDADLSGLEAMFSGSSSVFDYGVIATDAGPIPPGHSAYIMLDVPWGYHRYITLAGMLVTTNDAFTALRMRIPTWKEGSTRTIAYDAGSEANNEDCDYIPGPPCGSGGVRATEGAEGFVHVHAGVHGGASLDPAMHDWRNPVAEVTLRRVRALP